MIWEIDGGGPFFWCSITGHQGFARLSQSLVMSKTIKYLHLGSNRLGSQGAFCISTDLMKYTSLIFLDLR